MSFKGVQFPIARRILCNEPLRTEFVNAAVLKLRILDPNDNLTQDQVYDEWHYLCHRCNAIVEPVGIGEKTRTTRKPFKTPPHFSTKKGESHKRKDCNHIRLSSGSNKSSHKSFEQAFLEGYPNRLNLDLHLQSVRHLSPSALSVREDKQTRSQSPTESRNWSVREIKPLVEIFIKEELRGLPLHISGVEAQTYGGVFQAIRFDSPPVFDELQIYFGEIIYRRIGLEGNRCTFWLTDRCYELGSHGRYPRSRALLEIDISEWTLSEKSRLSERIQMLNAQVQAKPKNSQSIPLLFFLGSSDTSDNSKFSLFRDEDRFFSFLVSERVNNLLPEITFASTTEQHFPISPSNTPASSESKIDGPAPSILDSQVKDIASEKISEDSLEVSTLQGRENRQSTQDSSDEKVVSEVNIEHGRSSQESLSPIRDRLFRRASKFVGCIISGETPTRERISD